MSLGLPVPVPGNDSTKEKLIYDFGIKDKNTFYVRRPAMTALIAAYTPDRVIGNNGHIPWNIEGEQKRFKELTTGNIVIMGRKTFDEIKKKLGGPLPDRITVLVSTTTAEKEIEGRLYIAGSFEKAMDKCRMIMSGHGADKTIFIAGGAALYRRAVDIVDVMYITEVDARIRGDVFFPEFDEALFDKEIEEYHQGKIPYTYVKYTRK